MRRAVITGIGFRSPLGCDWNSVRAALRRQENRTERCDELDGFRNLNCRLACRAVGTLPEYPRRKSRSLGRVGHLAAAATEAALGDAGLLEVEELHSPRTGIAYGSCGGAWQGLEETGRFAVERDANCLSATSYVQIMPHSVAAGLSIFFGIHGRLIATSTACASGSQALGYAAEAVRSGAADIMVAGGAEELSPYSVAVFDALFATTASQEPARTPRPFDRSRDGIVVGEGAGTLIVEEREHALRRGAPVYAEILGFATNCDATHITRPSSPRMEECMRLALADASLVPDDIGYINAHGTGTAEGDAAEGSATWRVFGSRVPVATLKSYMGHTLGAAGALEAAFSVLMARDGWLAPNLNLADPDPACGDLLFIREGGLDCHPRHVMSSNFAFGGVNTSLIFRLPDD